MSDLAFETLPELNDWERANLAQAIERRRLDTVQPCVFCGKQAGWAYVAHTMEPPRWMDVCDCHNAYVRGSGPL